MAGTPAAPAPSLALPKPRATIEGLIGSAGRAVALGRSEPSDSRLRTYTYVTRHYERFARSEWPSLPTSITSCRPAKCSCSVTIGTDRVTDIVARRIMFLAELFKVVAL